MDNNKVLNALKETLDEYGISKFLYSINKDNEEAVVLIKRSTCWVVYNGKSNSRNNVSIYLTADKACIEFIKRISSSKDQEEHMIDTFYRKIKTSI